MSRPAIDRLEEWLDLAARTARDWERRISIEGPHYRDMQPAQHYADCAYAYERALAELRRLRTDPPEDLPPRMTANVVEQPRTSRAPSMIQEQCERAYREHKR